MRDRRAAARPPPSDRGIYVLWISWIALACALGFGGDFSSYLSERPPPPLLLHVHAAAYVLWLLLVGAQILLVENSRVALHRRLGWVAAALAGLLVALGLAAALVAEARTAGSPGAHPQFLALEFEELLSFSVLLAAGVVFRRRAGAHKRLMILATLALATAGFSRLGLFAPALVDRLAAFGPFGWWLRFYWGVDATWAAMAVSDLARRRAVDPSLLLGGAWLLGAQTLATALFFTPAFARLMAGLVRLWGWAG